jgi:NADH:ubiquinone oxidoreductase subunit E
VINLDNKNNDATRVVRRKDTMCENCSCLSDKNGPGGDEFTLEQWSSIDSIINNHNGKPGALIPVLEEIQGVTGYLPEIIQRRVSEGLGIPLSQIYGVVTFYSFFTMVPRGKHQIRVCLGTACHVRGGQEIINKLSEDLGIGPGECTEDRNFSIDIVRCLGCCALAPVMTVDDNIHKQLKAVKLGEELHEYKKRGLMG